MGKTFESLKDISLWALMSKYSAPVSWKSPGDLVSPTIMTSTEFSMASSTDFSSARVGLLIVVTTSDFLIAVPLIFLLNYSPI